MRLLAWNIRQGGGTRLPAIAAALGRHSADVLIISEYRGGDSGERLRVAVSALGYVHHSSAAPPRVCNGVLIASRLPLVERQPIAADPLEAYRLVSVEIGAVFLCGVY